jgi:microcystin-dependent protein
MTPVARYWDGSAWNDLTIGGGSAVYEQPNDPGAVPNGSIWIDTDDPTPQAAGIVPGVLMPYAGATAPSGYLLCDGAAVSRTIYAALFTAIGTAYGAGDGSTTFNVPDLRGRVPVAKGTNADVDTVGESDGQAVADRTTRHRHRHQGQVGTRLNMMKVLHAQYASGTVSEAPGASWFVSGDRPGPAGYELPGDGGADIMAPTVIESSWAGPAYLVVNYLIKT